jgi:hypothetical protein
VDVEDGADIASRDCARMPNVEVTKTIITPSNEGHVVSFKLISMPSALQVER